MTLVADSLDSYWQSKSSETQDEHDGRCPSQLLQVVSRYATSSCLAPVKDVVTYRDLRIRHALQARPTRRRLLAEGPGSWVCSERSCDDLADIVSRSCDAAAKAVDGESKEEGAGDLSVVDRRSGQHRNALPDQVWPTSYRPSLSSYSVARPSIISHTLFHA